MSLNICFYRYLVIRIFADESAEDRQRRIDEHIRREQWLNNVCSANPARDAAALAGDAKNLAEADERTARGRTSQRRSRGGAIVDGLTWIGKEAFCARNGRR